ncbi:Inosine-5'-monophosphate dehydrogenase protein [Marine Group I thaumarchaeote SCGC RSA3]|uniref:Inosine-5'-monophosphate dehydrogenase protein n=2 Tax=Marine Group I TaxID=905826 RepID=A0A081RP07_9ARCH|nr:Inosine-5'-monophosphate dehydrogenase protein [Marine Group I thaumarchaeote SCGC AAA799-N04]KFM17404.1 Inosine-5'-monophosphate dehydrogenase protein [Marine Group I thaumarchaeote SCGC RSA3]
MIRIPELTQIRKHREELKLNQRQLAKKCDIQPSYLNMIENGNCDPSYKVLVKISKVINSEMQKNLNKLITADKIFIKNLVTAKRGDSLDDTVKIMKRNDFSQIPVTDSHGCVGLITEDSMVNYIKTHGDISFSTVKVKDAMEVPPPSIDVDSKIDSSIMELLYDSRCVLVTNKGKLCGIITKIDAIRGLMKK